MRYGAYKILHITKMPIRQTKHTLVHRIQLALTNVQAHTDTQQKVMF